MSLSSGPRRSWPDTAIPALNAIGVAALAVVYSLRRMSDSDLWHHLRCGEHLFQTGSILRTFAFNAGSAALDPFLNHEWLFQALIYALERAGGEPALMALQVGLVVATLAISYVTARLYSSNLAVIGLVLGLGIVASSQRFSLRPQHLTYVFLALLLYGLHRYQRGQRRWVWALPVGMVVWVNVHAECLWGLLLPAGFLFMEWLKARGSGRRAELAPLAAALGFAVVATFANPFGFKTVVWPLLVAREMSGAVEELFPPVQLRYAPFWAYFALSAVAVIARVRRIDPTWAAASATFAVVAWSANRGIPHFVLTSAPLVVSCLDALVHDARAPRPLRLLAQAMPFTAMAAAAVFAVRSPIYLKRYDGITYPESAVRFMRDQGLGGGVMNDHLWGGYLLWHGRPELRPFIDGRFYARTRFAELAAVRAAQPGWEQVLERDGIDMALIGFHAAEKPWLADALLADPSWWLVYWDDASQLYLKNVPANAATIKRFGSKQLNPERHLLYQYQGSERAFAAQAREIAERDVRLAPGSYRAHILAGNACLALGDLAAAVGHYDAALAVLDPPNAWIYYQIARCRMDLGHLAEAEAQLTRCLALAPEFTEGRDALAWVRRQRALAPHEREPDSEVDDRRAGKDLTPQPPR